MTVNLRKVSPLGMFVVKKDDLVRAFELVQAFEESGCWGLVIKYPPYRFNQLTVRLFH